MSRNTQLESDGGGIWIQIRVFLTSDSGAISRPSSCTNVYIFPSSSHTLTDTRATQRGGWDKDHSPVFQMRKGQRGDLLSIESQSGGTLESSSFLYLGSLPPSAIFCQLQALPSWNKRFKVNCWTSLSQNTGSLCCLPQWENNSGQLQYRRGHIEDWVCGGEGLGLGEWGGLKGEAGFLPPGLLRGTCIFLSWGSCQCVCPGLKSYTRLLDELLWSLENEPRRREEGAPVNNNDGNNDDDDGDDNDVAHVYGTKTFIPGTKWLTQVNSFESHNSPRKKIL